MDDPNFWQKVIGEDFITPQIMMKKLQDLTNEIFGITKPKFGRGRWREKRAAEAAEKAAKEEAERKAAEEAAKIQDANATENGNATMEAKPGAAAQSTENGEEKKSSNTGDSNMDVQEPAAMSPEEDVKATDNKSSADTEADSKEDTTMEDAEAKEEPASNGESGPKEEEAETKAEESSEAKEDEAADGEEGDQEGEGDEEDEDEESEEEKEFELTKPQKKKLAKFMSEVKDMMQTVLEQAEKDELPSDDKAVCQKLLLTISVKEKLFNENQRGTARKLLQKLEGDRKRRCRTSDIPSHDSPRRRRRGDPGDIREELRIVSKKKEKKRKRRTKAEMEAARNGMIDEDGYKLHSDDENDWSDVGEDIYNPTMRKRTTISQKDANRRRQWAAGDEDVCAAGRVWPIFPRSSLQAVLTTLLDEVIAVDADSGGVFSEPVPRQDFPEYYEQIDNPMDYGTMRKKLEQGEYKSAQAMQRDFILVLRNCLKFNAQDSEIAQEARDQALLRPAMLRKAALSHGLFLAEDGSVLQIQDDSTKKEETQDASKKRKRGSNEEAEEAATPAKNKGTAKKKSKAKEVEEPEDEPPKKKGSAKKKGKAKEAEEQEEEPPATASKKKKSRSSVAAEEPPSTAKKKVQKGRSKAKAKDEDPEEEEVSTPVPPKKRRKMSEGTSASKKQADEEAEASKSARKGRANKRSGGKESAFVDAATWKLEREALTDPGFKAARDFFTKRGAWKLHPELLLDENDAFKDVALEFLQKMGKLDRYSVFANPVSDDQAPDYSDVIKKPMDMSTMRTKVEQGDYGSGNKAAGALYKDWLLMFNNCFKYNEEEGEVVDEAARLLQKVPETYTAANVVVLKKHKK